MAMSSELPDFTTARHDIVYDQSRRASFFFSVLDEYAPEYIASLARMGDTQFELSSSFDSYPKYKVTVIHKNKAYTIGTCNGYTLALLRRVANTLGWSIDRCGV